MSLSITDWQVDNVVAVCAEYGIDVDHDLVREIENSFIAHGAHGGGNRYGIVGMAVAREIERQREIGVRL